MRGRHLIPLIALLRISTEQRIIRRKREEEDLSSSSSSSSSCIESKKKRKYRRVMYILAAITTEECRRYVIFGDAVHIMKRKTPRHVSRFEGTAVLSRPTLPLISVLGYRLLTGEPKSKESKEKERLPSRLLPSTGHPRRSTDCAA